VSRYQKGKTNLDFTEARDSEWQWNLLDHMQVCTSLQADKHASTPPLSFLQVGCPSCHPTNSVKALKAIHSIQQSNHLYIFLRKVAELFDGTWISLLLPQITIMVPAWHTGSSIHSVRSMTGDEERMVQATGFWFFQCFKTYS